MSDLTVRDTAQTLATTDETVRRLIGDGLFPGAYRLRGSRGPWRIPPAALDAYREAQAVSDPWARTRPRRSA